MVDGDAHDELFNTDVNTIFSGYCMKLLQRPWRICAEITVYHFNEYHNISHLPLYSYSKTDVELVLGMFRSLTLYYSPPTFAM